MVLPGDINGLKLANAIGIKELTWKYSYEGIKVKRTRRECVPNNKTSGSYTKIEYWVRLYAIWVKGIR